MPDTRWLSDEEQRAWRNLAGVLELLPNALDAQLRRDSALAMFDYWILAMLSEVPEHMLAMSDLAGRSSSSLSRLSHAVARLEQRGFVAREPSPHDGRITVAVLTDEGMRKVLDTAPGHVERVRELVFDGLDAQEVGALAAVCERILDRLTEGDARRRPA